MSAALVGRLKEGSVRRIDRSESWCAAGADGDGRAVGGGVARGTREESEAGVRAQSVVETGATYRI